ncbi:MAG TPA: rhodanese-like domain-containing protein [Dehalococcoidia bacterium]|nr:rhodanese-like domain-containing protein [Dehalococcoidia bacterium]
MPEPIDPPALARLMSSDAPHAVLDIRSREAYVAAQVFASTTVPLAELGDRLPALVPVRTLPTVFVGTAQDDGRTAALAAEAKGFSDTRWLVDGIHGWIEAGLPTIGGWSVPGKDFGERLLVQEPVPEIDADELAALQASGRPLVVLDSRTPAEFARSCIPGARNVPGGELPLAITDVLAEPGNADATVVVNCAGRTRSLLGAFQLQRIGVPRVRALRNGTMGWLLTDRELERGRPGWTPHEWSAESRVAAEQAADMIAEREEIPLVSIPALQQLRAAADSDPLYVVDVRMPHEYVAGHLPRSLTIPGGQLPFSDDQLAVRGATIVTVCDGRARAILAASLWRLMGLPRVCVLDGGIGAWADAGMDLERGGEERPFGGGGIRTREEMIAYLEWEEALGEKYRTTA